MYITETHKYKHNNIIYVGGEVPENAEILETMTILNADDEYELVRISDNEKVGPNVWLKDDDKQDNYKEIKAENGTGNNK